MCVVQLVHGDIDRQVFFGQSHVLIHLEAVSTIYKQKR